MIPSNPYRHLDTRSLEAAQEVHRWDLADVVATPETWDDPDSSREFIAWHLSMADQEIERRRRLRHHPLAPIWPDGRAELTAIKQAIDLETLVERLANVRLTRRGQRVWATCPLPGHDDDGSASFAIQPDRQLFYCFGCCVGGDAFTFAGVFAGLPLKDAIDLVAREAGVERTPPKPSLVRIPGGKRTVNVG